MLPDSLIFFRVPLSSSAAKTGLDSRAMAMALLSKRGTIRMSVSSASSYWLLAWTVIAAIRGGFGSAWLTG
ncbi:hypothetical protein D3C72_2092690 [compost metagenome]